MRSLWNASEKPQICGTNDLNAGMPTTGGPLVTEGGLAFFYGTLDYYARALDNDTGEELWQGRLPVGGRAHP